MISIDEVNAYKIVQALFVDLARLNISIKEEVNSADYGSGVLRYQRTVNGQHYIGKQPWSMDFVYWCANAVWFHLRPRGLDVEGYHLQMRLKRTSSCVDQYNHFKQNVYPIKEKPEMGDVVLWEREDLVHGHTGIVSSVDDNQDSFYTIEGNTSDPMHVDKQTGVHIKKRSVKHPPAHNWRLLGFVEPFYYSND